MNAIITKLNILLPKISVMAASTLPNFNRVITVTISGMLVTIPNKMELPKAEPVPLNPGICVLIHSVDKEIHIELPTIRIEAITKINITKCILIFINI
ncbi:hypothetical protein FACS1894218_3860 [Bacilli bacterium]|nr:hypothetical protein FACS1894218_3860 [Bacilli bacterium]